MYQLINVFVVFVFVLLFVIVWLFDAVLTLGLALIDCFVDWLFVLCIVCYLFCCLLICACVWLVVHLFGLWVCLCVLVWLLGCLFDCQLVCLFVSFAGELVTWQCFIMRDVLLGVLKGLWGVVLLIWFCVVVDISYKNKKHVLLFLLQWLLVGGCVVVFACN